MLFALVDYIQYRFHVGEYSPRQLIAIGGFLADQPNLGKLERVLDGDLLFSHPLNWFPGWVVMYVQGSPFCHVAMLTKEQTVIEATLSGVIEQPAATYFDGENYLTIRRRDDLNELQRKNAVAAARSQIGCKFNWTGAIRLGLICLTGAHPHYRIRHGLDILLVLAFLWVLARHFSGIGGWAIVACAAIYLVLVGTNRIRLA